MATKSGGNQGIIKKIFLPYRLDRRHFGLKIWVGGMMEETDQKPMWTPEQQEHLTKMERALIYAVKKARKASLDIVAIKSCILALEEIIYHSNRPVNLP